MPDKYVVVVKKKDGNTVRRRVTADSYDDAEQKATTEGDEILGVEVDEPATGNGAGSDDSSGTSGDEGGASGEGSSGETDGVEIISVEEVSSDDAGDSSGSGSSGDGGSGDSGDTDSSKGDNEGSSESGSEGGEDGGKDSDTVKPKGTSIADRWLG